MDACPVFGLARNACLLVLIYINPGSSLPLEVKVIDLHQASREKVWGPRMHWGVFSSHGTNGAFADYAHFQTWEKDPNMDAASNPTLNMNF